MEKTSVPPNIKKMNDDLLKKDHVPDEKPKRNSKEFIIEKKFSVCDENNLELNISSTKLKRMSKEQLNVLLGELCEEAVKTQMAEAVGAKVVVGIALDPADRPAGQQAVADVVASPAVIVGHAG